MLITFRTISGEAFKLEFEESNTVSYFTCSDALSLA